MKTRKTKKHDLKTLIILGAIIIIGIVFIQNINIEMEIVIENSRAKFDGVDYNLPGIEDKSKDDFKKQRNNVRNKCNEIVKSRDSLVDIKESQHEIEELNERIFELNKVISNLRVLESSKCLFKLNTLNSNAAFGFVNYDMKDKTILINYVKESTHNFVHEATHAYQFTQGKIAFGTKDNDYKPFTEYGMPIAADLYDEVEAYKAQYVYDPKSVFDISSNKEIKTLKDIDADWVKNICIENSEPNKKLIMSVTGKTPEGPTYDLYDVDIMGVIPVDINTPSGKLPEAYPKIPVWHIDDPTKPLKDIYKDGIVTYENCKTSTNKTTSR